MGLISAIFGGGAQGVAGAVETVAGAFIPNAERDAERDAERYAASLGQFSSEFYQQPTGWFDRFVNSINRLPRPLMAFGTIGLFIYALASPLSFSERMVALELVPEPLWWLLGAVVGFYFGARELSHSRQSKQSQKVKTYVQDVTAIRNLRHALSPMEAASEEEADVGPESNAALKDWKSSAKK